jgi:hypothetical protein
LWAFFFRQREDFPYPCATRLSLAGYPSMERCAYGHSFDYSGLMALCTTPDPEVGCLVCVQ